MPEDKNLKEAIDVVNGILQAAKPYLFTIEDEIAKINTGQVTFTFRIYNGFVTDLVISDITRKHVYKK